MRSQVDCSVEFVEHSCDHKRSLNSRSILKLNSNLNFILREILYSCIISVVNNLWKPFKSYSFVVNNKTNYLNGFSTLGLILFSVIFILMPQSINSKPLVKSSIGPIVSSDTFSYAMVCVVLLSLSIFDMFITLLV
jgi:hypothetical protein